MIYNMLSLDQPNLSTPCRFSCKKGPIQPTFTIPLKGVVAYLPIISDSVRKTKTFFLGKSTLCIENFLKITFYD